MLVATLIITVIFFFLLYFLIVWSKDTCNSEKAWMGTVIFGLSLLGFLISIPISRNTIKNEIVSIKTFQSTIDQQRANSELVPQEHSGLTVEITKKNVLIHERNEKNAFWRSDLWIPDKWDTVEFIK